MIALSPNELTLLLKLVERLAALTSHSHECARRFVGGAAPSPLTCDCGLYDVRREARDLHTNVTRRLIDERNHTT